MSKSDGPSIFVTPGARVEVPIAVDLEPGATLRATFAPAMSPASDQAFDLVAYPAREIESEPDALKLVGDVPETSAPGEYRVARLWTEIDGAGTDSGGELPYDRQPQLATIEVLTSEKPPIAEELLENFGLS
jgi:hypothetical protein